MSDRIGRDQDAVQTEARRRVAEFNRLRFEADRKAERDKNKTPRPAAVQYNTR